MRDIQNDNPNEKVIEIKFNSVNIPIIQLFSNRTNISSI